MSITSDIGYFWILKNQDKHFTLNTTSMSTLETDVETYIFDFKYFKNEDNSGAEMFELKMNCYTGINKDKVYSYGVQLVNPQMKLSYKQESDTPHPFSWYSDIVSNYVVSYGDTQVNYFNSNDYVSYIATTQLNINNNPYVIDIEDKTYAFDFNKNYLLRTYTGFTGWKNNYYYKSNFNYFIYKMYKSMSNITSGEGVYKNLNVGINDVFNIYDYNELTGKFDKLTSLGYSSEFMGIKIEIINRGAKVHEDSMFNMIGNSKGGVIYG